MYLFEKDEDLIEIITMSELKNETKSELNMPLNTVSEDTVINVSISPR